ncbi:uncharacterized protein RJT20DRAFT_146913 [Scheffersomyces xylosifermentans]|uniref:uncharacterized protein n=1 Tax=Scheffersomyces xylosifermentans TaxID=1304137 RepID=UPI00315D2FE2
MPITLADESANESDRNYTSSTSRNRHPFSKAINSIRIYNIPLLNFFIISVLGVFLFKLTTKYTGLYMKSSLITIIVTNLVLYGISETMAQSILSYKPNQPVISFRYNEASAGTGLSFNSNDITLDRNASAGFNVYSDDLESDDEGIERFIDYLQRDTESIENRADYSNFGELPSPIVELTYFQFNRLAGFMCWGFIMAFVQCWWYKFLQIYSKDPKFIEVLRKVLTDQLCFSPISLFCFFTYGTIVLESGTWELAKKKLSKIYLKTLIINYSVWFPVQFFNFFIVPRNFQVPFSSSVSVLWNCFLSMRNSNS